MAEYLSMSEAEDKFGKKGVANAGLALGIVGTSLAVLNGGLGGIFGGLGGNASSVAGNGINGPTPWEAYKKECSDSIELTKGIYDMRIKDLNEKFDLYTRLDNKISDLATKEAVTSAQLPLMFQLANVTSERYTDDKVAKEERHQCAINFALQTEISKKIDGDLKLPWTAIYTGIPTMPSCAFDVTCGSKA